MSTVERGRIGLRRGGLVVVIALGLLSMHGFAAATPATADSAHHGAHDPGAAMGIPAAAAAPQGPNGEHDLLHAMGQTCIWLLVGGALLFLNHWFRRALTPRHISLLDDQRLGRTLCPGLYHPPDPRLASVILRC